MVDLDLFDPQEDRQDSSGADTSGLLARQGGDVAAQQLHLARQFEVVFDMPRLGLRLNDVDGAKPAGVEVVAFTEHESDTQGAAEACGQIGIGDLVVGVNGTSTSGLDYAAILDIVIHASRPVTLRFERGAEGVMLHKEDEVEGRYDAGATAMKGDHDQDKESQDQGMPAEEDSCVLS